MSAAPQASATAAAPRMAPVLSSWLDLVRVVSALVVFVGHSVALSVAPTDLVITWHRSADDAVIAFFVISGLVIAYSTRLGHGDPRGYALARLSRIYSGAIPAVLFALAIDLIGIRLDPSHYDVDWQYPRLWLYLPFHWAFLGETWFGAIHPFTIAPYWSLGYEVWYYVLFGCLVFLRGWVRAGVVLLVLAIMGPRIWLLLPTWWVGVWLYRRLDRFKVGQVTALVLMVGSLAAYSFYVNSGWRTATDLASKQLYAAFNTVLPVPFYRGSTVHVLSDYVVAVLFAVFVIGCASCRIEFGARGNQLVRLLAGYTFSFYLVHFTLLVFTRAMGLSQLSWAGYAALLGITFVASWLLAQVGEKRRALYQSAFEALFALAGRVWSRIRRR